jgi:hypothetical protein
VTDVLKAQYADLKTVKTRSTCQLILELPIEALTDVVALLGAPLPGGEVWVAVARLRPETGAPPAELPAPKRSASLAQIAGIMSNEGAFQRFIRVKNADEAAEYIRAHCHVSSRANIDGNEDATAAFRELKGNYELWMRGEAA